MQAFEFANLRDKVIEKDFEKMNDMQLRAVTSVRGAVLVLAGAGSGKTTVLVNRIACLVKYGSAYKNETVGSFSEADVKQATDFLNGVTDTFENRNFAVNSARPWEILAITFTNKAANELKSRIAAHLGEASGDIWAGTFHSVCGKILRRNADKIGYTSHFTIYDTDDQKKLIKEIMKNDGIDEKILPVKSVMSAISSAKDSLVTPEEYEAQAGQDYRNKKLAQIYKKYSVRMLNNDAMDFDDMINNTVKLFKENPDVLDYYSDKFKYIMVDEYQDTNHAQYVLIHLLAQKHGNICVVGDDDQSIYRFRGATIENILNFEDDYQNAKVIRLEQNYRSSGHILDAANAVIKHNKGRKGKNLWTSAGSGEKITVYTALDEKDEARYIADDILEKVKNGGKFSDNAVLYRMNAQSASLENVFARSGISYRVIGGMRFFERKEIKDMLAYLQVINNPYDDLRIKRIINEPKRGIGDTTIKNAAQISDSLGISLFETFKTAAEYPLISRAAGKLENFCDMISRLRQTAAEVSLHELFEELIEKSGYIDALRLAGSEEQDRIDNVYELASSIVQYEQENEEATLSGFLEEIALVSDIDSLEDDDRVVLMTIHSAKGLEFQRVYLIGLEEGIFPGMQSVFAGEREIEEERRLAYVAITRAKKHLTVTNANTRLIFGSTTRNLPSRFLKEIPSELCDEISSAPRAVSFFDNGGSFSKPYSEARSKTSYSASSFAPRKTVQKDTNTYKAGMTVEHKTFGQGTVISVSPMGDDNLLEIKFLSAGTKKLMANYAKLKII
ncbi:MAG: UvrD-helicase domain-containing protein [Clostridiales bacterium]|nr:UvrD-helicase domain-containing protein [Candidatus Equinaster intestinalis]